MPTPKQKPGRSKQDYETPADLIAAVERRFGPIAFDLAAVATNAKAAEFYTPAEDALVQDWTRLEGLLWLNPPFADIAPWARKCMESILGPHRRRFEALLLLVPASVGSNWFADFVHTRATVLALNPRLTFVGETQPYPKDCLVCVWGLWAPQFDVWRWKK